MDCWNCKQTNAIDALNCAYCRGVNERGAPFAFERYIVEGYLGHGTFGTVFKCRDTDLDRPVAVKRIEFQHLDADGLKALQSEIRALAALSSENIVQIYDVDLAGKQPYLVMEFLSGGNLADRIENELATTQADFNKIFIGICEGLRTAHSQKIIHRDIKPENIMFSENGTVKLTDFGLAKFVKTNSLPDSHVGTPIYMAPEIWAGEEYDERVDIWALGVVCYYIWTGSFPFEAQSFPGLWFKINQGTYEPIQNLNGNAPAEIEGLVGHMLTEKATRAASVEVLKNQIAPLDTNRAITNRPINDFQKQIDTIYGYKNLRRSPLLLLDHLSTNLAGIIGGLQSFPDDYGTARVKYYLPKSFGWLCAVLSAMNFTVEELIWLKFPNKCIYCESRECSCPTKRDKSEADANRDLLEKIRNDGHSTPSGDQHTLDYFRLMFRDVYGARNKAAGLDSVSLRLLLEVNEALDAVLQIDSLTKFDSVDVVHLELADVIAWFFGLLNILEAEPKILGPEYDFESEFFKMFNGKCYKCTEPKCRCPETTKEIQLFNWRNF